jgi:beta-xylosidase
LTPKARKLLLAACLVTAFLLGWYVGLYLGLPFAEPRPTNWAIGIYEGRSPLELSPGAARNPVLSASDVTDAEAAFVADPFIVRESETWYMFFEVFDTTTGQGDIAYATSEDGRKWTYQHIVLDEPFHLTYPYVFEWEGEWYMLPETYKAGDIRLYRAADFPEEWSYHGSLLEGIFADSSILRFDDKWWLFTSPQKDRDRRLRLYYADELLGPWTEHPDSPVVDWDGNSGRPGGRVVVYDGRAIRYAQDNYPNYGTQVYAFEITELTPTIYRDRQVGSRPIVAPEHRGWNSRGMHHVDPHPTEDGQWIAAVDGRGRRWVLSIGNR